MKYLIERFVKFKVGPKPKPRKFAVNYGYELLCIFGEIWFSVSGPAEIRGKKSIRLKENQSVTGCVGKEKTLSICAKQLSAGRITIFEEEGEE